MKLLTHPCISSLGHLTDGKREIKDSPNSPTQLSDARVWYVRSKVCHIGELLLSVKIYMKCQLK